MKTNVHFWSHLAHFFLEWEIFEIKGVEKIKTHILHSLSWLVHHYFVMIYRMKRNIIIISPTPKIKLWDNVQKYCGGGQHRWYNACTLHAGHLRLQWDSEYVILTAFPLQQWLHKCSLVSQLYIYCCPVKVEVSAV